MNIYRCCMILIFWISPVLIGDLRTFSHCPCKNKVRCMVVDQDSRKLCHVNSNTAVWNSHYLFCLISSPREEKLQANTKKLRSPDGIWWLSRPPKRQVPGSIPGYIGLIIRGYLRPSNGTVSRGSLYLVSMQEQVKHPIQVRNMSSLWWTPPLGLAKVGAARPINPIGA
jgi:hypothetical protein